MSRINRIRKENNFVQLDKGFLANPVLSAKSKGVLAYILSLPDDWVIYKSELSKHFKDGRESINSALTELEANGYLTQDKDARTDDGKMTHHNITVYEIPIHCGFSATGKPQRENRSGKPATTNNDLTKNNKLNTTTTGSEEMAKVLNHYQNNIAFAPSSTEIDLLGENVIEFGSDLVIYAMDEAVMNNVRKYRYIESILDGFRNENVTTLEQAKARTEARRNKQSTRRGGKGRAKGITVDEQAKRDYVDNWNY